MNEVESKEFNDLVKLSFELSDQDLQLVYALINIRRESGIGQDVVAARMGWTVKDVQEFESFRDSPTLSTLRRYALAVGATYTHTVKALDGEQL